MAFDEATAILAGDALLTLAFEILSGPQLVAQQDPKIVLQVVQKLAKAAGYNGMVDGQMRDIEAENVSIELAALELDNKVFNWTVRHVISYLLPSRLVFLPGLAWHSRLTDDEGPRIERQAFVLGPSSFSYGPR